MYQKTGSTQSQLVPKKRLAAIAITGLLAFPFLLATQATQAHGDDLTSKKDAAASTSMGNMDMSMDGKKMSMGSKDMHESMMMGMKDMDAMSMTGDTDQDFAMMMKKHHQGAIDMAKIELKHGKDAELKDMAQKIVDSQQAEIKQFEQWQETHKQSMTQAKP